MNEGDIECQRGSRRTTRFGGAFCPPHLPNRFVLLPDINLHSTSFSNNIHFKLRFCKQPKDWWMSVTLSVNEAPGGYHVLGEHFVFPSSQIDLSSCQTSISIQPVFQTTFILKCKPIENTKTDEWRWHWVSTKLQEDIMFWENILSFHPPKSTFAKSPVRFLLFEFIMFHGAQLLKLSPPRTLHVVLKQG